MFIDLSVPINNQTPAYPGDPKVAIEQIHSVEHDNFTDHIITTGNHAGTHIDAPAHMIEGGQCIHDYELDVFSGPATLVDVSAGMDITKLKQADIKPNSIVLLRTGAASRYYDASYFTDFLTLTDEMAHYLVKKNIKLLGIDTCSIDAVSADKLFPIHKIILGAGIPIIENLSNLEKLLGKSFTLYAFPLRMQIDAAPARVVAQIEE